MQVGCCLCTGSETDVVVEVLRHNGVHRAYVNFAGVFFRTRFDEVLYERFQSEEDILEALQLLHVLDELVDAAFALGQLHLTVLIPEVVVLHLGIGVFQHTFPAA